VSHLSPHSEPALQPDAVPVRPSIVRWEILGLMLLLSMITYLDRVNISIATRHITNSYHLSDVQMGKIFSAFIVAYGLFQVPCGWLADRFGPHKILTLAILWWSLFTALTAYAADLLAHWGVPALFSLCAVRFCLGMGEAAAWPCFNRAIANWMAMKERAFAASIPLAGGGAGAAITPPFIAWLMLAYGWRQSFVAAAALGVIAAALWYFVASDNPQQHPRVNTAEIAIIRGQNVEPPRDSLLARSRRVPWRILLTDKNVWLLFSSAMTCGYMVYIYMTWFFTYLVEQRHLSQMTSSYYTVGPFIAMAVLTPIGGLASDLVARKVSLTLSRRVISMAGMFLAGLALMVGARTASINVAIFWLSIGAGAIYFALASHWATTIDISVPYAATISGIMNCGGNVGGFLSPILTPVFARQFGWVPAFDIAAILIILGGALWFVIDPARKIAAPCGRQDDSAG
jgi:ACS family glucarate transporter-like MFS transporter